MSGDKKDESYKGPTAQEAMVGREYIQGAQGFDIGLVTGAAVGAIAGKPVGEKIVARMAKK